MFVKAYDFTETYSKKLRHYCVKFLIKIMLKHRQVSLANWQFAFLSFRYCDCYIIYQSMVIWVVMSPVALVLPNHSNLISNAISQRPTFQTRTAFSVWKEALYLSHWLLMRMAAKALKRFVVWLPTYLSCLSLLLILKVVKFKVAKTLHKGNIL